MSDQPSIRLIVNADDYGYFPHVSRGIMAAAQSGSITATGIMANAADLPSQLAELTAVPELDLGVHLNLTSGCPLTAALRAKLAPWHGQFPGAYRMSLLIMSGKISLDLVRDEWHAQIQACQSHRLRFLNSHEHIHMLPVLFPLVLELATAYRITHVRLTSADWLWPTSLAGLIRNSLMQFMYLLNRHRLRVSAPLFLGLSQSGKLDIAYLAKIMSSLHPGQTYELMCHPGYQPEPECIQPRLLAYHAWATELAVLQSRDLAQLYQNHRIILSSYPD
ncbi:ChbG/HpnK family deacetylase [Methylomonas paludis]|uniref:ChbG/HpnK family deacetylase n=1 Tax=Methylomonas paludis TaxID=1173101 RepID=A0A975MM72_9GAMM|nr:ChbG/HpnK family deacetylase [Methylomonas paludis]QWF70184.1 ChbG/HpnK family deacetylase [Methylomonas paludis]